MALAVLCFPISWTREAMRKALEKIMEPRAYFEVPSEREWTIAEREEFFAGQDAITGLINGTREPDLVIEQWMTIEEIKRRYPNTPIPGQDHE